MQSLGFRVSALMKRETGAATGGATAARRLVKLGGRTVSPTSYELGAAGGRSCIGPEPGMQPKQRRLTDVGHFEATRLGFIRRSPCRCGPLRRCGRTCGRQLHVLPASRSPHLGALADACRQHSPSLFAIALVLRPKHASVCSPHS